MALEWAKQKLDSEPFSGFIKSFPIIYAEVLS
jgi:hypothetical protein